MKCAPPFDDIIVQLYNTGGRKFQIRAASIGYGKHPDSCVRLLHLDDMAGFVLDPGAGKEVAIPADHLRAITSSWASRTTRGGWLWVTVAGFGRYEVNVSTDVDSRIAHPDGIRLALGEGDFNGQLPTAKLLGLTYDVIYKPTIGVIMK